MREGNQRPVHYERMHEGMKAAVNELTLKEKMLDAN